MTVHFVTPNADPGPLPLRPDTQVDTALDRLRNRILRKPFAISIDLLDDLIVAVETVAYALENDQILEQRHDYHPLRAQAAGELHWIRRRANDDRKERAWSVREMIDRAEDGAA